MHKSLRISAFVLIPVLTLAIGWQIGRTMEQQKVQQWEEQLELLYGGQSGSGALADPEKEVDISLLWGVWRILSQHYIDPQKMNTQHMVEGAVAGMMNSLEDPYTVFMSQQENVDFHDALDGKLEGIGAELTVRDGLIVVVSPLKGSPAEAAGLHTEDIILEVDGFSLEGQTLTEAVTRIRGNAGTKVNLLIARKNETEPVTLTITRAAIHVPSVEWEVKKTATGSIGYISVNQFGSDTVSAFQQGLEEVLKPEHAIKGVLVDMRYNGGGYLEGAVDLSSMFLKEGTVVSVARRNSDPVVHEVTGNPMAPTIPVTVLINEGTASASEIFAGALQDNKRAKIVGMTSFGKGTVQEIFDLPGGASVRVTVAKWLTPSGKDLGHEGVHPDIEVNRTQEDREAEKDPQMDAALEWMLDGQDVTGGRRLSSSSASSVLSQ